MMIKQELILTEIAANISLFNMRVFCFQEQQTENVSSQNVRIARVEDSCHSFEQQSRELAQVKAKCTELEARLTAMSQNVSSSETGLPGWLSCSVVAS